MFTLSKHNKQKIQEILNDIGETGVEGLEKAWLVWANLSLETISYPDKTQVVTRLAPLVMVFDEVSNATPEQIQKYLNESILKTLFQAKLNGRNELNMEDAARAIEYVKQKCMV